MRRYNDKFLFWGMIMIFLSLGVQQVVAQQTTQVLQSPQAQQTSSSSVVLSSW